MNNLPNSPSSKPSLEALLRVKRGERPDAAFWSDFEVRLRQRQLAAIIEPKPWWLGASLALRRFSFPVVAIGSGAAALVAFTLIRNGTPVTGDTFASVTAPATATPQLASVDSKLKTEFAASLPVEVGSMQEIVPAVVMPTSASLLVAAVAPVGASERIQTTTEQPSVQTMGVVEVPSVLVLADGPSEVAFTQSAVVGVDLNSVLAEAVLPITVDDFPAVPFEREARDIASVSWNAERAVLPESDFMDLASVSTAQFATNASFSPEGDASVTVGAASGSRFERLLSADSSRVVANSSGSFAQVRDRVLHHLGGDEELYASVSRLGLGGDRLSLRF